jgi:hypothetical protein
MMAYRIPPLDDVTAAHDRELLSRARIEADLARARRDIEAAQRNGSVSDGLASRLHGLIICRRLLDGPERCARPPAMM